MRCADRERDGFPLARHRRVRGPVPAVFESPRGMEPAPLFEILYGPNRRHRASGDAGFAGKRSDRPWNRPTARSKSKAYERWVVLPNLEPGKGAST